MILIRFKNKSSFYFKKDSNSVSLLFESLFHYRVQKNNVTQHKNRKFECYLRLNDNQTDKLNNISKLNKKNIRTYDDDFILF